MTLIEESVLSFYKELDYLDDEKNIFLVRHTETGVLYVKKILKNYNIEIFRQLKECRIRGIPEIIELIEDDGKLYLIEEFIHGRNLEDILIQDKLSFYESAYIPSGIVLTREHVFRYMNALCDILSDLHKQEPPIIHRDIKPSNIMVSMDGVVKLIDFDAARFYEEGEIRDTKLLGTDHFAAPEQYGFGQSDVRTDIYAFGVTLNVLLTGEYPNKMLYGNVPEEDDLLDKQKYRKADFSEDTKEFSGEIAGDNQKMYSNESGRTLSKHRRFAKAVKESE